MCKKEVFGGKEEREEVNVKRQPTGSKIIFYQDTQQTQKLDRFSFSLLCVCMWIPVIASSVLTIRLIVRERKSTALSQPWWRKGWRNLSIFWFLYYYIFYQVRGKTYLFACIETNKKSMYFLRSIIAIVQGFNHYLPVVKK